LLVFPSAWAVPKEVTALDRKAIPALSRYDQ